MLQQCFFILKEGDFIPIILPFFAGVLSFLSPCVLPLIPAYVSYLTGSAIEDINNGRAKARLFYKSIGFVIGFTIIFLIMGASISSLGKLFAVYQETFRKAGGILIIILGLHTIGIFKMKALYYEKKLLRFGNGEKSMSSVFVGMAFAAGWTPCVGPILSSILIYAGSMETVGKGILLLSVYSLGLALPFLFTAFTVGSLSKFMQKFSKYLPVVSGISGVLMIVMGILLFANKLSVLSGYLNFINFY